MGRVWSSGFELNSLTAGVEVTNSASAVLQTAIAHGGTYALKIDPGGSAGIDGVSYQFVAASSNGPYFFRVYVYLTTAPGSDVNIISGATGAGVGSSSQWNIRLRTTGSLALYAGGVQVGSNSTSLNLNQWYRLEIKHDSSLGSGSRILNARIDGTQFAGTTTGTFTGILAFDVGWNLNGVSSTTGLIYYDDIAINDNSGSFQNSYPDSGQIIHQRPASAGDSTQWTPDTGSNFARVNEVTPDDITSLVSESILNKSDFYAVGSSILGASDVINVVSVGGRFRNDVADATTNFQFQIEKTSGGTTTKSAAITPNTTTWNTNATAAPKLYPITLYQDPDSGSWTKTTVESMQIGVIAGTVGVNKIQLSTIWALVDYTPAAAATGATSALMLSGYGA